MCIDFDQVTFTTNEEESCVDKAHFRVFSYRACAVVSEAINIGQ